MPSLNFLTNVLEAVSAHPPSSSIIFLATKSGMPFSFSSKKKADVYFRLKRLIDKNGMGELFKVMLITNKKTNFRIGF